MAAPMSCTSQSASCCISLSFASGGKSVTPPTDHGSMSRLRFGLTFTLQMTVGVVEITDPALFCNVLCREGVQCNVVYLGGFSMGG